VTRVARPSAGLGAVATAVGSAGTYLPSVS
jgi:hypothetical protein